MALPACQQSTSNCLSVDVVDKPVVTSQFLDGVPVTTTSRAGTTRVRPILEFIDTSDTVTFGQLGH